MFNWIQEIFCKHEWEHKGIINVSDDFGAHWKEYLYVCKKCKAHKRRK